MTQTTIKRITLFKIPNEKDIAKVLDLYSTLQADAKKVRLPINTISMFDMFRMVIPT